MFSIDTSTLGLLDPRQAVHAFRDLLFAIARRDGISVTRLSISSQVNVPDGGVDASIIHGDKRLQHTGILATATRYQIKTGDTAAPWQEAWVHNELFGRGNAASIDNLGTAVRRCLDENGRYVLVCFGLDPTDELLRAAERSFVDAFRACGYSNPRAEVWCKPQLKGLFDEFPGLCMRLSGNESMEFRSHSTWSAAADMSPRLRLSSKQAELMEEIRSHLRSSDVRHIRLLGESGVGKSRLALEATRADDLAPVVVFVRDGAAFQSSLFFGDLIRAEDQRTTILVIDECLPKDRASIWNLLAPKSDRIRLICLDHGPDDVHGHQTKVVTVPQATPGSLAEIISDYGVDKLESTRWAKYCGGSPRVAHLVGENLRSSPDNLLRSPSIVDVWERFVLGHDAPHSETAELRWIALRHIALFQRFGFEQPVDSEARFIAEMAGRCDPRLTWSKFQSVVVELKRRRILQGATTLYITPQLLQVYLWQDYWEHYGRDTSISERLGAMPPQLWKWFASMLRYAHTSQIASEAVDRFLRASGIFSESFFPDDRRHGELIMTIAETSPAATLRCLERTVGVMTHEMLLRFVAARQHVIWALQMIVVWEDLFVRGAALLLKLAAAENTNTLNNATGTLKDLFSLVPGKSETQASPSVRFPVLKSCLDSERTEVRAVGLKLCASAMSRHGGMRIIGPEHQGLREKIEFWIPATWGEIRAPLQDVWNVMVSKLDEWNGDDRRALFATIIESAQSALGYPFLTDQVLSMLERSAADPDVDIEAMLSLIQRALRFRDADMTAESAQRLHEILSQLDGYDFASRLRRIVKYSTYEDAVDEDGKRTTAIGGKLDQLAAEAKNDRRLLDAELPWLARETTSCAYCFAFRLAQGDGSRRLLPDIVLHQIDETMPTIFLAGYLAAIFNESAPEWERIILELAAHPIVQRKISNLVIESGMTDDVAVKIVELCRTGAVERSQFDRWYHSPRLFAISERVVADLIDAILSEPASWATALKIFHSYYLRDESKKPLPNELTFRLLTHHGITLDRQNDARTYYWSTLAQAYLTAFPDRRWDFFTRVLSVAATESQTLSELELHDRVLTELVQSDPKKAWECVAEILEGAQEIAEYVIRSWLADDHHSVFERTIGGTMQYFPSEVVFPWIDQDPLERARWLARAMPRTLDETQAGRLTHAFVAKYGIERSVGQDLESRFHHRGWCGNESDMRRGERDAAQAWLRDETNLTVITWIRGYIDLLTEDIKRAEIQEERD